MKNWIKNILSITALLLVVVLLFGGSMSKENAKTKNVPISDLASLINQDKIKTITIKENLIISESKTGEKFVAKNGLGESFFDVLKYYDISSEKLSSVEINFVEKIDWGNIIWFGLLLIVPLFLIFSFIGFPGKQNKQGGPGQIFNFHQSNIKQFVPSKSNVSFNDVAGMKEEKEELLEIVDFLKNSKKFTDLGAKIPKGVLLMGAPGTGKTLLARSIAGESGVPFFHISGSEFVEMFVGVGASRVRSAFAIAKKASPAILFIDEIDAIGRERGSGIGGGQDEREQTLNQILVEMDGFDNNTNVIVVAATNRPDVLDPALLRPGRFDRRVVLHLPDLQEREEILALHLKNKKVAKKIDIKKVAERTPGFSGADLANLANEATLLAAKNNFTEVSENHILDSIEKVLLGPERRSHVIKPKEKEITAYHEGGHALVAAKLKNADPIHKISIISRGRAAGYTLQLPSEDKSFLTKSEMLDELATLMGGYAAEELIFGEISTGSANDLKVCSEKARKFIVKYGMSSLGPISLADEESVFLGRQLTSRHNYSEELSAKVDKEMVSLVTNALTKAKDLLKKHEQTLKKVATVLLEKETLEKDDFYKLLEEK